MHESRDDEENEAFLKETTLCLVSGWVNMHFERTNTNPPSTSGNLIFSGQTFSILFRLLDRMCVDSSGLSWWGRKSPWLEARCMQTANVYRKFNLQIDLLRFEFYYIVLVIVVP